ncbi:hypothetical protein DPSP01_009328 [Paraphaeosphaeria sporulosa]
MEAHVQQSDELTFALDDWSQFEGAPSLILPEIDRQLFETLVQEMAVWESNIASPPQAPTPYCLQAMHVPREHSWQPAEHTVMTDEGLSQFDATSLDGSVTSQQLIPNVQRVVAIEKGQNRCPLCNKAFRRGGSAVRAHINCVHIGKRKEHIRLNSSRAGRPKAQPSPRVSTPGQKNGRDTQRRSRVLSEITNLRSSVQDYITLAEFRTLQYELVVLKQERRMLLDSMGIWAQCDETFQQIIKDEAGAEFTAIERRALARDQSRSLVCTFQISFLTIMLEASRASQMQVRGRLVSRLEDMAAGKDKLLSNMEEAKVLRDFLSSVEDWVAAIQGRTTSLAFDYVVEMLVIKLICLLYPRLSKGLFQPTPEELEAQRREIQ